jgi:hypothetical protein
MVLALALKLQHGFSALQVRVQFQFFGRLNPESWPIMQTGATFSAAQDSLV